MQTVGIGLSTRAQAVVVAYDAGLVVPGSGRDGTSSTSVSGRFATVPVTRTHPRE
ncbi:hypothetical protein [Catenulispora acidiphila]|uniref:hypothetical protein n=1 Tax=Catenulispora acidiphila TaxID=304895 RepID=UPI00167FDF59|nr:hypothetical protein [Catenulispora acidiphila]